MNIDEMPTPETDAVRDRLIVGGYEPHECFREWQNSHRDLERRLTIARETLTMIIDTSPSLQHAERMADEALKQTAPKP